MRRCGRMLCGLQSTQKRDKASAERGNRSYRLPPMAQWHVVSTFVFGDRGTHVLVTASIGRDLRGLGRRRFFIGLRR